MGLRRPSEELIVRATADGLAQVFGNLIGNAVKYTPQAGRVTVRVSRQGSTAVASVTDTGIGIPAEDMAHLWEEFFRASNARRSEIVGTGLGLSIVKRLVETLRRADRRAKHGREGNHLHRDPAPGHTPRVGIEIPFGRPNSHPRLALAG